MTFPAEVVPVIRESRSYTVDAKHQTFLLGHIESALARIRRGDVAEFLSDPVPEGATVTITLTFDR